MFIFSVYTIVNTAQQTVLPRVRKFPKLRWFRGSLFRRQDLVNDEGQNSVTFTTSSNGSVFFYVDLNGNPVVSSAFPTPATLFQGPFAMRVQAVLFQSGVAINIPIGWRPNATTSNQVNFADLDMISSSQNWLYFETDQSGALVLQSLPTNTGIIYVFE